MVLHTETPVGAGQYQKNFSLESTRRKIVKKGKAKRLKEKRRERVWMERNLFHAEIAGNAEKYKYIK